MSTSTPPPKKPPSGGTPSTARKAPTTSNAAPAPLNRSPSRMAANSTSTTATGSNSSSTVDRTRSVRNGAGTPVSARVSARKTAGSDSTIAADEDIRAETQAKFEELQVSLTESEQAFATSQKQAEVLQIKLDEALKDQAMLEDHVQEHTERTEELETEKKEAIRARREMEHIVESERAAMLKEREESQLREDEMQRSLVRMKEAMSQQRGLGHGGLGEEEFEGRRSSRPLSISRTSSFRSGTGSPNPEAALSRDGRQFAPSSSLQRSDSRSSSQLVNQKDKIIEGLKLELAEAHIKVVELENKGGANLHLLEKDMYQIKMLNARLMEENESFQLLLREKTLNGDFGQSDMLRAPSSTGGDGSRPPSRYPDESGVTGTSLADELAGQDAADGDSLGPDSAGPIDNKEKRFHSELNSLKDQNKALTTYINNIISRLLQHDQFEQLLDKTPDLMAGPGAASMKYAATLAAPATVNTEKDVPPPPPPKDEKSAEEAQGQQSLLQRAGSVLRGRPGKPSRPMSQMLAPERAASGEDVERVNENPDTAPRIPLGRSGSSASRAHRRTGSDWPAASVVTNMYRGPSPGLTGPTSPGLGSPIAAGRGGSFFPLGAGARAVSGNSVPTIDEIDGGKENAMPPPPPPHADFKPPPQASALRSDRNSVALNPSSDPTLTGSSFADPSALSALTGDVSSNPSSPPRSTTSSGERDTRPGGAVMMGSKPRPLRLVQESAAAQDERKAANRGSWFGWMNKGASAANGLMPGRSISGGTGEGNQQQQQ